MNSDVSPMTAGACTPGKGTLASISWIQVITGVVQFYCVMCHCVFLMLIALWMVVKELSLRFTVLCKSWHDEFKQRQLTAMPPFLEAFHVPVITPKPTVEAVVEVALEKVCEPVAEITNVEETHVFQPLLTSLQASLPTPNDPDLCLFGLQDSFVKDTESLVSVPLQSQGQPVTKRPPCSISAVVEDKYACGLNTSTSSSTASLEDMDDSSEDEALAAYDCSSSKSGETGEKSGDTSSPTSWKLRSALTKVGKLKGTQDCFPKKILPLTPSSEKEKKFSLAPVISNIRRACSRTFSAINKELSECMTPQAQKSRRKSPALVSQVAFSQEGNQPPCEAPRDTSEDLALPEARTPSQSSWNDDRSSGGCTRPSSSVSDSFGEMHRGLLESFSEGEASEFPQRPGVDLAFGDGVIESSNPPFPESCILVEGAMSKGDSSWADKSRSDAFFHDDCGGAKPFEAMFHRNTSASSWDF